jgi:hypothetical protein
MAGGGVEFVRFRNSLGSELKHGRALQGLARLQDGAGKRRLVRRVRVVLGFEAEAVAEVVGLAAFAGEFPVEEVAESYPDKLLSIAHRSQSGVFLKFYSSRAG